MAQSREHELFLPAASAREFAIKYPWGRLRLPMEPGEFVRSRLAASETIPLAALHNRALQVAIYRATTLTAWRSSAPDLIIAGAPGERANPAAQPMSARSSSPRLCGATGPSAVQARSTISEVSSAAIFGSDGAILSSVSAGVRR